MEKNTRKKTENMKKMTELEEKVKKGEELNKEDIWFLY